MAILRIIALLSFFYVPVTRAAVPWGLIGVRVGSPLRGNPPLRGSSALLRALVQRSDSVFSASADALEYLLFGPHPPARPERSYTSFPL